MGIRDFIEQRKQMMFAARDSDKLKLQQAELMRQRKELQEKRNLQAKVREEQKAIRDLKSEPIRRKLSAVKQGFQNLKAGAERSTQNVQRFSSDNPSPFSPSSNPFGRDAPARKAEKKPKTVTINIRG